MRLVLDALSAVGRTSRPKDDPSKREVSGFPWSIKSGEHCIPYPILEVRTHLGMLNLSNVLQ